MTQASAHSFLDVFGDRRPRIFSLDSDRSFLPAFVSVFRRALAKDQMALAESLILTPTRRSARALAEAFRIAAEREGVRATLLPSIRPLGDIDDDDESALYEDHVLPPAISSVERRLTLAQLIVAKDRAFAGSENWSAALGAANELAKLLDSFYTEEIPFSTLKGVAPERFAAHWAKSLEFLEIVTDAWPRYLESQGLMDPADRMVKRIRMQTEHWRRRPPARPVAVIGTTGSAPAVASLIGLVATMKHGVVLLPGLDRDLANDPAWAKIDDPHPQAGLRALLDTLNVNADRVMSWPGGESLEQSRPARRRLISLALRPAGATGDWRRLMLEGAANDPKFAGAVDGMSLVESADEEEEATIVSILMRETLETPGATAMLVTPDRNLARRTALKMKRWGVLVDDSGGLPFHHTPCGVFLRLLATWLQRPSDAVATMALARHPLAGFGLAVEDRRRAVEALDIALRGLQPFGDGAHALQTKIDAYAHAATKDAANLLVAKLIEAESHWRREQNNSFDARIAAHIAAGEHLADTPTEAGAMRLWRGEDGETGAFLLAELRQSARSIEPARAEYASVFTQLIAGATVRRRAGAHPRLSILGPLEARLLSADRIILGGLNEGVWPGDAPIDPFLSRPMRAELGLPSPERRIGLAAHDFAQLAAQPEVFLTRAAKSGGAPAKPSRWLLRLKNILSGGDALESVDQSARLAAHARALDEAGSPRPVAPPNFAPPREARLSSLYVTRVGRLLRDPYGVYASQILKLRKREALAEPFSMRHMGNLLHAVFEQFAIQHPRIHPENAEQDLHARILRLAPAFGLDAGDLAFWRRSISQGLTWFAQFHRARLELGEPCVIEGEGAWTFEVDGAEFTLKARADRIDRDRDGRVRIFDYKSKKLPSLNQISADFNPQLPLTGLIAQHGGFKQIENGALIDEFAYLRVFDRPESGGDVGAEGDDARGSIEQAALRLRELLTIFNDPQTPFLSQPRPEFTDDWGEHDQLARRREWSAQGGDA